MIRKTVIFALLCTSFASMVFAQKEEGRGVFDGFGNLLEMPKTLMKSAGTVIKSAAYNTLGLGNDVLQSGGEAGNRKFKFLGNIFRRTGQSLNNAGAQLQHATRVKDFGEVIGNSAGAFMNVTGDVIGKTVETAGDGIKTAFDVFGIGMELPGKFMKRVDHFTNDVFSSFQPKGEPKKKKKEEKKSSSDVVKVINNDEQEIIIPGVKPGPNESNTLFEDKDLTKMNLAVNNNDNNQGASGFASISLEPPQELQVGLQKVGDQLKRYGQETNEQIQKGFQGMSQVVEKNSPTWIRDIMNDQRFKVPAADELARIVPELNTLTFEKATYYINALKQQIDSEVNGRPASFQDVLTTLESVKEVVQSSPLGLTSEQAADFKKAVLQLYTSSGLMLKSLSQVQASDLNKLGQQIINIIHARTTKTE